MARLCLALDLVVGRKLSGEVTLGPGQALVVAKFCFDFNPACLDGVPCLEPPGKLDLKVYGAAVGGSGWHLVEARTPKVTVALLDDEYFSYPEVSQVWGEANCSDVAKAAKKALPLHWLQIASEKGERFQTFVLEKIRPRWWYVALASCSDHSLSMSYDLSVQNPRQGFNEELSMDEIGLLTICFSALVGFAALSAMHLRSVALRPAGSQLLSAALLMAGIGQLCWYRYFRSYQATGEPYQPTAMLARTCVVTSKSCTQILLMFLATGDAVCRPGIAWGQQREMLLGMAGFSLLGLALEVWGDREASGSPIEYMYDTRPGVGLLVIEMLWFYAYVSRCYQTWSKETRLRPRRFYKRFALALSLWFLTLPAIALLASALAPWVRFRIVFAVNSCTHALASSVLVYIYHESVAPTLFEMKTKHREVGRDDELQGFLEERAASFGACSLHQDVDL